MKKLSVVCFALFLAFFTACFDSKSDKDEAASVMGNSIIGSWGLTYLEGAPSSVNSSNSVWNIKVNGTYDWFFYYAGYYNIPKDDGSYTINGNHLCVTGVLAETVFEGISGGCVDITPGSDLNSFSFLDDEGDKWTYKRL
jgi:hypothetical protein